MRLCVSCSSEYVEGSRHQIYLLSCGLISRIILPMMQSYSSAGDFTVMGKLKFAILENAIIYGSFLLILTVCVIYVAVKPELHFNRFVVFDC